MTFVQDLLPGATPPNRHRGVRVAVDVCAALCLLLGEPAGVLLPAGTPSMLGLTPIFVSGVGLLVIRHLVWPRPSLPHVLLARARSYFRRPGAALSWGLAVGSRATVYAVGLIAITTIGYTLGPFQFRVSHNEVQNLPARFDAGWYLGIARHGYEWNEELRGRQQDIAFFPAYPALMRAAGELVTVPAKVLRAPMLFGGGDARVLWGGVILSLLCFALAAQRMYELALVDTADHALARRSLILFASYPFALFFGAAYSEALFALALTSTLLAWRRGDLARSAAWGVLAGLTRSNGWTLSFALAADAVGRVKAHSRRARRLAAATGPALGAAIFSAYVYRLTGNPLEWTSAQQWWGHEVEPMAFVTRRLGSMARLGPAGYIVSDPVDAITIACVLLVLTLAGLLAVRRQWLYATFIVAYLAPALALDLPATGRMTAVLVPAFIALAGVVKGWTWVSVVVVFAIGQAWLASRFFLWKPPF